MNTADTTVEIEYPETDGKPMGETEIHIDWMFRIRELLKQRYQGQQVYVGCDLLVYYQEGEPRQFVVPDNFVALNCDPGIRRTFKIWEENAIPDVVFEVSSRCTAKEDRVFKPQIYQRLGGQEYFLYDPEGAYMKPALQGFRRTDSGFVSLLPAPDGSLVCETLGVMLMLEEDDLVMFDTGSGERLLTPEEFQCKEKELEREARLKAEAELASLREQIEESKRQRKP